jgi:serine/threonine protein kinase
MGRRKNTKRKVTKRKVTKRKVSKRKVTKSKVSKRKVTKRMSKSKNIIKSLNDLKKKYKFIKVLTPYNNAIKYGGGRGDYSFKKDDRGNEQLLGEGSFGEVYLVEKAGGGKYVMKKVAIRDKAVQEYYQKWEPQSASLEDKGFRNRRMEAWLSATLEDILDNFNNEVKILNEIKEINEKRRERGYPLMKTSTIDDHGGEQSEYKESSGINSRAQGLLPHIHHKEITRYIVMSYLGNTTMLSIMHTISSSGLAFYITQITETLDVLHKHNIYHNDIKSDNIMIHNGSAYLIDFGSAKNYPDFIPEKDGGNSHVPSSRGHYLRGMQHDIYSLGIILLDFMVMKRILETYEVYARRKSYYYVIENGMKEWRGSWNKEKTIIAQLNGLNQSQINITHNYIEIIKLIITPWPDGCCDRDEGLRTSAKDLYQIMEEDMFDKLDKIEITLLKTESLNRNLKGEYIEYFESKIKDLNGWEAYILYKFNQVNELFLTKEDEWRKLQLARRNEHWSSRPDLLYSRSLLNFQLVEMYDNIRKLLTELYPKISMYDHTNRWITEHDQSINEVVQFNSDGVHYEAEREAHDAANKHFQKNTDAYNYDPVSYPIFLLLPITIYNIQNEDGKLNYKDYLLLEGVRYCYGYLLPPSRSRLDGNSVGINYRVVFYVKNSNEFKTIVFTAGRPANTWTELFKDTKIIKKEKLPEDILEIIVAKHREDSEFSNNEKIVHKKNLLVNNVNALYLLEAELKKDREMKEQWRFSRPYMESADIIQRRIVANENEIQRIVKSLNDCADKSSDNYTNYCEVMINAFIYNELIMDKDYPSDTLQTAKSKYRIEPDEVTVTELAQAVVEDVARRAALSKVKEKLMALAASATTQTDLEQMQVLQEHAAAFQTTGNV